MVDVSPFAEFGGWGYRVGRGGRVGIVLRSGPALQVERTGGRSLVVTVDDAATGAALLNTLAARARVDPTTAIPAVAGSLAQASTATPDRED